MSESLLPQQLDKSFLQSKTIWGAIIISVGYLLQWTGVTLAAPEIEQLVEKGLVVVGLVLTVFGRFVADKPVALRLPG